jgi:hypothetical protein
MSSAGHVSLDWLIDALTVGVGLLVSLGKAGWRLSKGIATTIPVACADLLNGAVIVPFFLMIGAVFSNVILTYLRTTSPVSTAIAGAIGLFFVVGELRK